MKHTVLFFLVAFLLISGKGLSQNNDLKGSIQCSMRKSSMVFVHELGVSPNSPRHAFDVLNYKLNLDIRNCFISPYPKSFVASNEVRFRVDTALSSIALNAVNTSLVIDSVRLAGTSFTHASNILTITLNRTYAVGETVAVRIFYRHNNVSDAAFYVSNGMVFTDAEPEGARKWFPCWDKPSDKATLDLMTKTPSTVKLGSNGRLADSTTVGDTTWFHWVSRDPISTYLVVISAKVNYGLDIVHWRKISNPNDSIPLRFYYNIGENPTAMEQRVISMTTQYSTLFVEHPFEKNGFATLNSQFTWGGMENQTLTSLCTNCWSENLISHEYAHQWFGDMITCGTWADIWLNEGFATYCEALWYEYTGGYSSYKNDILNDASGYLGSNPGWPMYNASWAITTPPTGTLFNTAVTYYKGACVLHMLRYTLGDSLFFAVLKSYATDAVNFKLGNVVTADFITKVSQVAGQDMSWFFTWVYQPNHPVYGNTYNITSLGGGQWQVGFKARQTQTNAAFFPMPLTLRISFTSGSDTTLRVMNSINNQVFAFRFGRQPALLVFDPNNDIVIKQGNTTVGSTVSAPTLVSPPPDTLNQPLTLSLMWNQMTSAATYRLQLATDSTFAAVVVDDSSITDTSRQLGPLPHSTQLYWRVSAKNSAGSSPFSAIWRFRTLSPPTNYYGYADAWNLVSVPLKVDDRRKETVFPLAVSYAYSYASGYVRSDTLENGVGYWLRFNGSQNVPINGWPLVLDTIEVISGWNLVGSISNPVAVTAIAQVPPGIVASSFYGFDAGYVAADTLQPGRGYWVAANVAGSMILSAGTTLQSKGGTAPLRVPNSASTIRLSDFRVATQTLCFTSELLAEKELDYFELPPPPPAGIFDARFSTNRMLEVVKEGESKTIPILVSDAQYPLTISWDMKDQSVTASLTIGAKEIKMTGAGSTTVTDADASIALRLGGHLTLPKEFALQQNYPNPFNPSTTIKYDLPKDAHVSLKLFNILGQEVATLVNEEQKAGYKSIEWNPINVASGVYFYRLQAGRPESEGRRWAGDFVASKKLLFVR